MSQFCSLHPTKQLLYYCQFCHDAVCQTCISVGPHNDSRHKIIPITQAAQVRIKFYFAYIKNQINPLRERVCRRLEELSSKQQEFDNDRKVIEKDINIQFQGIQRRINMITIQEVLKRQNEIKNYQQVINKLDDLQYSFDGVAKFPQRFLMSYKQFHQQLKQLQNMHLITKNQNLQNESWNKAQIDSEFYQEPLKIAPLGKVQLPRQFALSLSQAQQIPEYSNKNVFMNQLVIKALTFYKTELAKAVHQIQTDQKRILSLYNNTNMDFVKLDSAYVCAYCLIAFSIEAANESCSHNKGFKSQPTYKHINVPENIRGQKMHYWVSAQMSQRPIPDMKTHYITRNLHKKLFFNLLNQLKQVKYKLLNFDINKGKSGAYLAQFQANDPQKKGLVSPLAFLYIMTNKFQVDEKQVKILSELCLNCQEKAISYLTLQVFLEDTLKPYREFIAIEQQTQKAKPIAPPTMRYRY